VDVAELHVPGHKLPVTGGGMSLRNVAW
jgi:hypothetical protein